MKGFEHNIYYQTQEGGPADFEPGGPNGSEMGIRFRLIVGDTRKLLPTLPDKAFDLVYHDPFSPRKQPELWTTQLFRQYNRILRPDSGAIMTYSAAAPAREAMHSAGLFVYRHPAPVEKPGTIAFNHVREDMPPLSDLEKGLMRCKSGIPFEDDDSLGMTPSEILQLRSKRLEESRLPTSSSIHRQYGAIHRCSGKRIPDPIAD